ncbi:MAG: hypothetical protein ACUVS1_10750 [Actinomycetota bacterium]
MRNLGWSARAVLPAGGEGGIRAHQRARDVKYFVLPEHEEGL